MAEELNRVRYLIGEENLSILAHKTVMVCGVGGVGSFVAEALARSGVGSLILVDADHIDISNLNRQLMTTKNNIGRSKVEALKERLQEISDCKVLVREEFIRPGFTLPVVDYVADCIDTLTAKMYLAKECKRLGIPLLSALGSAQRLRAEALCVTRLAKTRNDPLARNWRLLCKKERFPANFIRVVYCDIPPQKMQFTVESGSTRKEKFPLGSLMFVVGAVGLKMAEVIYGDLLKKGLS